MEQMVDASGFYRKTKEVKTAMAVAAAKVIMESAQEVYQRTNKNLSGMHFAEGEPHPAIMPIAVITGTLRRSLKIIPLSSLVYAIFTDKRIAKYCGWVHDGTKRMRKRPFLRSVIQERRQAIQNRIRYALIKAIRSTGRK
jgi:hypothetical protein